MSKKLILSLMILVFFLSHHSVLASLSINEIMYDLSGADSTNSKSREWVEIYNPDSADVLIDATKWRIYDGSANRTINGEVNFSIPAGAYVIWAGDKDTFLADHPGFSGTVYDTGISSLNNTGAVLKILDQDGNVVDTVTYASTQGGAGDGNSLQKISSSWTGAIPTPEVTNEAVTSPPPTADSSGGGSSNSSSGSPALSGSSAPIVNKIVEEPKMKTKIISKTLGFVGLPLSLEAKAFGFQGEQLYFGKYFWNFGDGDSKEILMTNGEHFIHTYFYPGEYAVSLDFYRNRYSDIPDASDQITIKIVPADIIISRVGDEKDFFIELTNNTNYNADISNWTLSSGGKNFILPKNTILAPSKKIIISPKISHFSIEDKSNLKLITPQGEIAFDYSPVIVRVKQPVKTVTENFPSATEKISVPTPVSLSESLPASVSQSDIKNSNDSNSAVIFVLSFVFVGLSAYTVYFIRQKRVVSQVGSDFEILDE